MKNKVFKLILIAFVIAISCVLCGALSACDNQPDSPNDDPVDVVEPGDKSGDNDVTDDPDKKDDSGNGNGQATVVEPVALGFPVDFKRVDTSGFDYSWRAVENAVGYHFYVSYLSANGAVVTFDKILTADKTAYSLTPSEEVFPKGGLDYTVTLVALGDNVNYVDGQASTSRVGIPRGVFEWMPIDIYGTQDFLKIADGMALYYRLAANIDFKGAAFHPIGATDEGGVAFTGGLDGNGKKLMNITISTDYYNESYYLYVGIFGRVKGAHIHDLTIENYTSASPAQWYTRYGIAGVLCGYMSDSNFENINVVNAKLDWTIYNNFSEPALWLGGLSAVAEGNYTVEDCRVDVDIKGAVCFDDLAESTDGVIKNYYAGLTVAGGLFAICGNNNYTHDGITAEKRPVSRCSSTGTIRVSSFDYSVGGLVGDCYPFAQMLGEGNENVTAFSDCMSDMDITVQNRRAATGVKVSDSAYKRFVGLLIGRCRYLSVERCFSSSTIDVTYFNDEDLRDDYVNASMPKIGFLSVTIWSTENSLGLNREISNCYYTRDSLVNISVGNYKTITKTEQNCGGASGDAIFNHSKIVGVEAQDITKQQTYANFDFDNVWKIENGALSLR